MSHAEEEFCPSCGGFYEALVPDTGWCASCTGVHHPDSLICPLCFSSYNRNTNCRYCPACKNEGWLREHADEIEEIMLVRSVSFTRAKQLVRDQIRPTCVSCGESIKGGNPDALFCKVRVECRKARRRYRTLKQWFPAQIALQQLLRELDRTPQEEAA